MVLLGCPTSFFADSTCGPLDSRQPTPQPATSSSPKSCSFRMACPRAAGESPPVPSGEHVRRILTSSATASRVVEFSKPEEAQRAIRELNDQQLLGRPLFIREVRFFFSDLALYQDRSRTLLATDAGSRGRGSLRCGCRLGSRWLHGSGRPRPLHRRTRWRSRWLWRRLRRTWWLRWRGNGRTGGRK